MKKLFFRIRRRLEDLVMGPPRERCNQKRREKLENQSPTIIASDCFGGIAYHNLGLPFRSPTINLCFAHEEFPVFVRNLRGYLAAELVRVDDPSVPYPVGELEYGGRRVRIRFMHYKSFDEARDKWNERKGRVDFSNIYIIQTIPTATEEMIRTFDALPYRNKMLITGRNLTGSENVWTHPVFLKEKYRTGEFLEYKSAFALERYMDEIDYVSFLNRPNGT